MHGILEFYCERRREWNGQKVEKKSETIVCRRNRILAHCTSIVYGVAKRCETAVKRKRQAGMDEYKSMLKVSIYSPFSSFPSPRFAVRSSFSASSASSFRRPQLTLGVTCFCDIFRSRFSRSTPETCSVVALARSIISAASANGMMLHKRANRRKWAAEETALRVASGPAAPPVPALNQMDAFMIEQ